MQKEDAGYDPCTAVRFHATLIVSLMLIAPNRVGLAQSATIAGVVSHGAGQVLSGVTVTATPESGGPSRHMKTSNDGTYRFEGLSDGTYRVDFDLPVFAVVRRNHVSVRRGLEAKVDTDLPVRALCECITILPPSPWAQRAGQVIDKTGHPLPHARVNLVDRQVAYTDSEGRFLIRLPVNETWPLTATDTGFRGVTQQVSGADAASVVLTLEYVGTTGVHDVEHQGGCECDLYLLSYSGR